MKLYPKNTELFRETIHRAVIPARYEEESVSNKEISHPDTGFEMTVYFLAEYHSFS